VRLIFIQPRRNEGMGFRDLFQVEPLGLEMIAGALMDEVRIIDLKPLHLILREVSKNEPDMCGVSCSFTVDVGYTLQIAREIKKITPGTFLFVGGHHASINPEDFHAPYLDAVVCGEGENTVKEMVTAYKEGNDLRDVKGLVLNYSEEQEFTEKRSFIKDLDNLPYPGRHLVDRYRKHYYHGFRSPIYALETTRGCPYRCKFCSVWRYYRGKYRIKSAERVIEEIKQVPGKNIFVTDDNFFNNVYRAEQIGEELLRSGVKKEFVVQARSDDLVNNPYLIDLWQKVGLKSVLMGFEQIDQEGLDKLNKKNSVINNENALNILQKKDISVMASFIVDPQSDYSDFKQMLDYIRRWNIKIPSFSVLTPLPGTRLYEEMKDKLITTDYRLFDFLHAVTPTRLPLRDFYRELAGLWAQAYNMGNLSRGGLGTYFKHIIARPSNLSQALKFYRNIRQLFDSDVYMADQR